MILAYKRNEHHNADNTTSSHLLHDGLISTGQHVLLGAVAAVKGNLFSVCDQARVHKAQLAVSIGLAKCWMEEYTDLYDGTYQFRDEAAERRSQQSE